VTVAVGAPNSSQEIRLTTLSSDVDEPHSVTFPVKPEPGVPSWANYMKGVIAHYPGKSDHMRVCVLILFYTVLYLLRVDLE